MSSSEDTKLMARPLVPNLPALPTWRVERNSYSVEVGVGVHGHIVVDDDVDMVDVYSPSEDVSRHHDPALELFEGTIAGDANTLTQTHLPVLLVEVAMDGDRGEVALEQELVELDRTRDRADEDDDLVEDEGV